MPSFEGIEAHELDNLKSPPEMQSSESMSEFGLQVDVPPPQTLAPDKWGWPGGKYILRSEDLPEDPVSPPSNVSSPPPTLVDESTQTAELFEHKEPPSQAEIERENKMASDEYFNSLFRNYGSSDRIDNAQKAEDLASTSRSHGAEDSTSGPRRFDRVESRF